MFLNITPHLIWQHDCQMEIMEKFQFKFCSPTLPLLWSILFLYASTLIPSTLLSLPFIHFISLPNLNLGLFASPFHPQTIALSSFTSTFPFEDLISLYVPLLLSVEHFCPSHRHRLHYPTSLFLFLSLLSIKHFCLSHRFFNIQ